MVHARRNVTDAEREYVNQRLELEQQALQLEYALREVRERQADLDQLWRDEKRSSELDKMQIEERRARAEFEALRQRNTEERIRRELSRGGHAGPREGPFGWPADQWNLSWSLRGSDLFPVVLRESCRIVERLRVPEKRLLIRKRGDPFPGRLYSHGDGLSFGEEIRSSHWSPRSWRRRSRRRCGP